MARGGRHYWEPAVPWREAHEALSDIFRLLLLTGARRGEVLAAKWDDLDLTAGVWTKPGATTKQRLLHRVPLSAPARQLLADLRASRRSVSAGKGSVSTSEPRSS